MNKHILAAAVAAVVCGTASAQTNVQVYGLMDLGLEHISNASASGGSVTNVSTGGTNNSRFGFRGTEDLGNGLKAVFNLEGGILADTGNSDGALFRRQSNVGLEGSFGRVVLGRSYTTVYDFINPFDPMGYAPHYSWGPTGNGTLSSKYGMTTGFDNIVKYSGEFAGLKIGASFGAGEVPGNAADGRKLAAAVGYETGPLRFAFTGERVNGTSNAAGARSVSKVYHAAAAYKITKAIDLKVAYRNYKLTPASGAEVRADTWWTGANYQLTPVVTLIGVVYFENVKAGATPLDTRSDPMMFELSARYALSKRTFVYTTAAHAKAKDGGRAGLTRDSSADGGNTGFSAHQTGLMLGIQHRF
jgi:predicted porin